MVIDYAKQLLCDSQLRTKASLQRLCVRVCVYLYFFSPSNLEHSQITMSNSSLSVLRTSLHSTMATEAESAESPANVSVAHTDFSTLSVLL